MDNDIRENFILSSPTMIIDYVDRVVQGRWKKCEGYLFAHDLFRYAEVLYKYGEYLDPIVMEDKDDPQLCAEICKKIYGKPLAAYEYIIAKSSYSSIDYASYFNLDSFELSEDVILESSYYSYLYAAKVIKGRWERGESVIALSSGDSFNYAKYVIRGRFPEGEIAIGKVPDLAFPYARYILQDRFPEGEEAILSDGNNRTRYIKFLDKLKEQDGID